MWGCGWNWLNFKRKKCFFFPKDAVIIQTSCSLNRHMLGSCWSSHLTFHYRRSKRVSLKCLPHRLWEKKAYIPLARKYYTMAAFKGQVYFLTWGQSVSLTSLWHKITCLPGQLRWARRSNSICRVTSRQTSENSEVWQALKVIYLENSVSRGNEDAGHLLCMLNIWISFLKLILHQPFFHSYCFLSFSTS